MLVSVKYIRYELQWFAVDCTPSHFVATFCFIILLLFALVYHHLTKVAFSYWKDACIAVKWLIEWPVIFRILQYVKVFGLPVVFNYPCQFFPPSSQIIENSLYIKPSYYIYKLFETMYNSLTFYSPDMPSTLFSNPLLRTVFWVINDFIRNKHSSSELSFPS